MRIHFYSQLTTSEISHRLKIKPEWVSCTDYGWVWTVIKDLRFSPNSKNQAHEYTPNIDLYNLACVEPLLTLQIFRFCAECTATNVTLPNETYPNRFVPREAGPTTPFQTRFIFDLLHLFERILTISIEHIGKGQPSAGRIFCQGLSMVNNTFVENTVGSMIMGRDIIILLLFLSTHSVLPLPVQQYLGTLYKIFQKFSQTTKKSLTWKT